MPTGTGKTVVIAEIVRQLGCSAIILAHRTELLDQAARTISAHIGQPVGRIQASEHDQRQVTVASVQTLVRRLDRTVRPNLLVIDEAHHACATSYRAAIEWSKRTSVTDGYVEAHLVGVTATPYRLDEAEDPDKTWRLGQIFGEEPAYSYALMDAVRDGYLVPIRQWGVATETSLDDVGMSHGDLAASGLLGLDTPERNALVADSYRRLCEGRQAIAFAVGVDHAKNLATTLQSMDVPSEAIWGELAPQARADAIARYASGKIRVIVNVGILTEGFDDPQTSALLMARPTASRGLYVQMAGRGLRPSPTTGKDDCVIVDFLDSGSRHSLTLQSALRLAGCPDALPIAEHTAQGRKVVEVAQEAMERHLATVADLKEQIRMMPLKWTARDRTPRWSMEKLSLAGYQPEMRWQLGEATDLQIKTIKGFHFKPRRDLTKGEASVLIDRLMTLEAEDPEPATAKQKGFLRWKGGWVQGMTKREAARAIARHMVGGRGRP
jgi:superfamily II DNA or RNA helicase